MGLALVLAIFGYVLGDYFWLRFGRFLEPFGRFKNIWPH
jgi:hypothetical protein